MNDKVSAVGKSLVLGLITGALGLLLCGCEMGYLLSQGYHQAKLLAQRRPVEEVLDDASVAPSLKDRIRLVQAVCDFGEKRLGLKRGNSYRSFIEIQGPVVAYVVSACPKDNLLPHTWRFPILGNFPYKGFFSLDRAKRERQALEQKGYDTHLAGATAFSALGWFADPIYSSMLRMEEADLAYTIFHEMVHTTVFFPNQVEFNEQLATLVGWQAAADFFQENYPRDSPNAQRVREALQAERALTGLLEKTRARLVDLYATDLNLKQKIEKREEIFRHAREQVRLLAQEHPGGRLDSLSEMEWNNASFLALWRYRYDVGPLDSMLFSLGGNLRALIRTVRSWKDQGLDPVVTLERELRARGGTLAPPP